MAGTATGPEFDPRYDARYQRGWTGEPADDAGAPERDPLPPHRDPDRSGPRVARDDPEHAPAASPSPSDPVAVVSPAHGVEPPAAGMASAPTREAAGASGSDPAPAADEGGDADRIMRVAFGIAWAAAGLALAVGAWSVWTIVSQDPFGPPSGVRSEEAARMFAYLAGPAALMAGVAGAVILLVADGLRRARLLRRRAPSGSADGPVGGDA